MIEWTLSHLRMRINCHLRWFFVAQALTAVRRHLDQTLARDVYMCSHFHSDAAKYTAPLQALHFA